MRKDLIKNVFKRILVLESKVSQFEQLVSSGKMPQDILDGIWNNKIGRWIEPFNDDEYRKILFNSFDQGQAHDLDYFENRAGEITRKIIRPMRSNRMSLPIQEIPGVAVVDLNPRIKPKFLLTIDECDQYISAIEETDSKSKKLKDVLYKGLNQGETSNFEVVYKDKNIIIVYPKSYLGSIATARMGPGFRYHTPPNTIGELSWCTSIASGNNMFLNYHRKLNLHMYYITKLGQSYDTSDRFRKTCVSIAKQHGSVKLADESSATVDGNNKSLKKKEIIDAYGDKILSIIMKDASNPSRKEIDEKEYYRSITLSQFKTLESAAIKENEELSISLFLRETNGIALNSNKPELLRYLADTKDYYKEQPYVSTYNIPLNIINENDTLGNNEKVLMLEDILYHRSKSGEFREIDRDDIFNTLQKIINNGDIKVKKVVLDIVKESNNSDLIALVPLIAGYQNYLGNPKAFAIAIVGAGQKGEQELYKILGARGRNSKPKTADEAISILDKQENLLVALIDVLKGTKDGDAYGYKDRLAAISSAFLISKRQYSINVNEFVPNNLINISFISHLWNQLYVYSTSSTATMAIYYAIMKLSKEKVKDESNADRSLLENLMATAFFPKSDSLEVSRQKEIQKNILNVLYRFDFLETYVKHIEKGEKDTTLNYFRGLLKHAKIINYPRMKQLKIACVDKMARIGLDVAAFVKADAMRNKLGPGEVQSLETLAGDIALMTLHLEKMFKEEKDMRDWRPDGYE